MSLAKLDARLDAAPVGDRFSPGGGLLARLGPVGRIIRVWRQRIAARRSLAEASARDLRDIGLSPSQVAWEIRQPFWRPLSNLRDY